MVIRKAAPAAPNAIARGPQLPEEDSVGTRAPTEERRVTPPERALRGAIWRELTAAAPVPKAGAGDDVSGARPNWDTISASPDQPSTRDPEKRGKSGSTREKGATRPRVAATPTLRDLLRPCTSPGQGSDKTRTGKAVKQATQVASLTVQKNPSRKRHTPHPAPPSISKDAVPIPPGTKYPSVGAGQRYSNVLLCPLSGMFTGQGDSPTQLTGEEKRQL